MLRIIEYSSHVYDKSKAPRDRLSVLVKQFCKLKKLRDENKISPQVGLEPTTNRLTADRSTAELLRILVLYVISYHT